MKAAVLGTYSMMAKPQNHCTWFWTDLGLLARTGTCPSLEGLGHISIKLRWYFLFGFLFVCKMNSFKNSIMHLKAECVYPECESFVASVSFAECFNV